MNSSKKEVKLEILNGFLVNTELFRQAHIYMSPFTAADAFANRSLANSFLCKNETLPWTNHILTNSATDALIKALGQLGLHSTDEVWIETTSNNRYISGCVTRSIEAFCRWNRKLTSRTKAILVNHEFGFCYENLRDLERYKLPIIEDAAYSMFSQNNEQSAGKVGNYVIYSLAKMFPVQAGGILAANHDSYIPETTLNQVEACYFDAVLHKGLKEKEQISARRKLIYESFEEAFAKEGLSTRFSMQAWDIPGAFLFKTYGSNLQGLKAFLIANGVECSVFYGEESFYIPCHQNLNEQHIEYLLTLIKYYLK